LRRWFEEDFGFQFFDFLEGFCGEGFEDSIMMYSVKGFGGEGFGGEGFGGDFGGMV